MRSPAGVLAVGPSPELALILQCSAVGALVGTYAAARFLTRPEDRDRRWLVVARGSVVGAVIGTIAVLADLVGEVL